MGETRFGADFRLFSSNWQESLKQNYSVEVSDNKFKKSGFTIIKGSMVFWFWASFIIWIVFKSLFFNFGAVLLVFKT